MKKDRDDPPVALVPVPGIKVDKGGSFDDGDPGTTNLYVGNIAPTVTGRIMINRIRIIEFDQFIC